MFAARASMPANINVGRIRKEPPPASAFCAPAQAATRKSRRSIMACYFRLRRCWQEAELFASCHSTRHDINKIR